MKVRESEPSGTGHITARVYERILSARAPRWCRMREAVSA